MPKICVLPNNLSNKIAAGEVVERPASVVKELLENALDAESTRIIVEVEKGGQSLIQVSDNGVGMSHADALFAIERYATSKISTDNDLFSITSLGFRGEALPSIASVSRFTLITRDASSDVGTEIIVDGGKIQSVSEVGAPAGTMISVKELFFNTPARKKFLKTVGTEMGHIADTVARLALGHPEVQFRLNHNNKAVKSWPLVSKHLDRAVDVLGKDVRQELQAIEYNRNGILISGWVCSPKVTRRTSRGVYIFVNGRFVRDRTIQHGVFKGFAQRLVKGQFPIAVVFLKVPFDQVDVNVHPAKNEVRFRSPHHIHEAVRGAVAQALYEADRARWGTDKGDSDMTIAQPSSVSEFVKADFGSRSSALPRHSPWPEGNSKNGETRYEPPYAVSPTSSRIEEQVSNREFESPSQTRQAQIFENRGFSSMRVLGQLHNTYILCESDTGLVLIDQHAAHERIYFEQLKRSHADHQSAAQKLLVPETIELNFSEAETLGRMAADLTSLGLEIEPFGKNTFVIKSVPALLSGRDVKPLIHEIVEKAAAEGYSPGLKDALDQCRMVMACHGALRANQALSQEQIRKLLEQLDACENPSHCPHGRPTWIRWDLATLEKSFKRII